MSTYDAVRPGSTNPWVSSTRPAITNVYAVQSRHVVRGQSREPSNETGARITTLQTNSARPWLAVSGEKPTQVPRSLTQEAISDWVPDVGASSATPSSAE